MVTLLHSYTGGSRRKEALINSLLSQSLLTSAATSESADDPTNHDPVRSRRWALVIGHSLVIAVWSLVIFLSALPLAAQIPSAFTYQGRLDNNGLPASGNYDLQFILRDAPAAGRQVGDIVTRAPVALSNGL